MSLKATPEFRHHNKCKSSAEEVCKARGSTPWQQYTWRSGAHPKLPLAVSKHLTQTQTKPGPVDAHVATVRAAAFPRSLVAEAHFSFMVEMRACDGYVDATKLCNVAEKHPRITHVCVVPGVSDQA